MPTNGLWIDLASAWIAAGEARLVSSADATHDVSRDPAQEWYRLLSCGCCCGGGLLQSLKTVLDVVRKELTVCLYG